MNKNNNNSSTPLIDKATSLIIIGDNNVKNLSTGSYKVYLVHLNEGDYVYKSYSQDTINSKSSRRVLYLLEKNTAGLAYRFRYPETDQHFSAAQNLEVKVLKNWEEVGIEAPRVVENNHYDKTLLTYMNDAVDYAELINKNKFEKKHLDAFLEKIHQIRNKAAEKKDKYLLHNDLYLQNFMYSDSKGAIPIDPGLVFKEKIGFNELDAYFNLFASYACISPLLGYKEEKKEIFDVTLNAFLDSLDVSTLHRMRELNAPAHPIELGYLRLTSKLGWNKKYKNFIEIFNKEQYKRVNTEINKAIVNKH